MSSQKDRSIILATVKGSEYVDRCVLFFLMSFFSGFSFTDKAQSVVSQASVQSSVRPWYLRGSQSGSPVCVLVQVMVLHVVCCFLFLGVSI